MHDLKLSKLTIVDTTNELEELIKEYSIERVYLIDKYFPYSDISTIESILDERKEESLFRSEHPNVLRLDNIRLNKLEWVEKFGSYFKFSLIKLN